MFQYLFTLTKKEVNERHINLLLIAADDTNHYCFIKDFGKLVGSQYSSANKKTYFCRFCLHGFSSHSAFKGKAQKSTENAVLHLLPNEPNFQMILFSSLRIYRSRHLQFMQILRAF